MRLADRLNALSSSTLAFRKRFPGESVLFATSAVCRSGKSLRGLLQRRVNLVMSTEHVVLQTRLLSGGSALWFSGVVVCAFGIAAGSTMLAGIGLAGCSLQVFQRRPFDVCLPLTSVHRAAPGRFPDSISRRPGYSSNSRVLSLESSAGAFDLVLASALPEEALRHFRLAAVKAAVRAV